MASRRKVGTGLMGGDGGRRAEVKEKRTTCNGVDDSGSSSRLGQPARHLRRRDRQASHVTSRPVGWNWTGPPRFDPSLHSRPAHAAHSSSQHYYLLRVQGSSDFPAPAARGHYKDASSPLSPFPAGRGQRMRWTCTSDSTPRKPPVSSKLPPADCWFHFQLCALLLLPARFKTRYVIIVLNTNVWSEFTQRVTG